MLPEPAGACANSCCGRQQDDRGAAELGSAAPLRRQNVTAVNGRLRLPGLGDRPSAATLLCRRRRHLRRILPRKAALPKPLASATATTMRTRVVTLGLLPSKTNQTKPPMTKTRNTATPKLAQRTVRTVRRSSRTVTTPESAGQTRPSRLTMAPSEKVCGLWYASSRLSRHRWHLHWSPTRG